MPRSHAGRYSAAALAMAVVMLLAVSIAPAAAASTYRKDVYFAAGYERQVNSRTCTAAAVAMMLNFIARRDLRLDQRRILRWEQRNDALDDRVQKGSDPLGWSRALTQYSWVAGRPTRYEWEAHKTETGALKRAALQIARTGKPVGLLVRNGTHAMVMTGFVATRDPRKGSFRVLRVIVSDPLGSKHRSYTAATSPLNKYLETDATRSYDRAWYGKYVIVVPRN